MLTIYLKCGAGLGKLTDAQKQTNPYTFVSCPHREDAGMFAATSSVTMRNGENGVNPIQTNAQNSPLYQFFKDVPSQYALLSDVTTLGTHKYTYQIGGLVGQLGVYCGAAPPLRRLEAQEEAASANATSAPSARPGCQSGLDEKTPAPVKAESAEAPNHADSAFQVDASDDHDSASQRVNMWVREVTQLLQQLPEDKSREPVTHPEIVEMERMVCMFYEQCYGGTPDYSEAFKKAFGVTEPPLCRTVVAEVNECKPLRLSNWKQVMDKYFVCSGAPAAAAASSNATSVYGTTISDQ